jgi:hypothetical protein
VAGEEPATEAQLKLLAPCASECLKIWPVGKRVGNVRNDSPDLLELMVGTSCAQTRCRTRRCAGQSISVIVETK